MNHREKFSINHQKETAITPEVIQKLFFDEAKSAVLKLGLELLKNDVEELCGRPFERKHDHGHYRGGSAPTSIVMNGSKVPTTRPRVKNKNGFEVELPTLGKLQSRDLLDEQMFDRIVRGVSTRNYDEVVDGFSDRLGVSKSSVSRAFIRASQKSLNAINEANLDAYEFSVLLIDGTHFDGKCVVAAVGITSGGVKIPLGLKEGTTENAEVVKDLISSFRDRNFKMAGTRILALTDGGKALRSALKHFFGENLLVQRCWIHKLRNLKEYIPEEHHNRLFWRMKKVMALNTFKDAEKELEALRAWLAELSVEAENSLKEAGPDLLTLHKLGITGELRKSLYTTNIIESLFSVVKNQTKKVKNWKYHPKLKAKIPRDKILRWVASAIAHHQKKMKRIRGYRDLEKLTVILNSVDQFKMIA
jgi:transposase-like protein